jgi:prefoldin beta subunit
MDEETTKRIQNLQALEQDFQQLLMQKQNLQLETNETTTALTEIAKTKGDVFRVLGQIMVKSNPTDLKKELTEKKGLLDQRIQIVEKQETSLRENIERIRNDLMEKMK